MIVTQPSTPPRARSRPDRIRDASALLVFPKQYPDMRMFTGGEHCRFNVTFQGQPGNR